MNIRANLWFDSEAEEAAHFYIGIFKDSKMGQVTYFAEAGKKLHASSPAP